MNFQRDTCTAVWSTGLKCGTEYEESGPAAYAEWDSIRIDERSKREWNLLQGYFKTKSLEEILGGPQCSGDQENNLDQRALVLSHLGSLSHAVRFLITLILH